MSTCADVGSVIESKMLVVQTSNVGITSEVSDYLVVHTGPGQEVFSTCLVHVSVILNYKTDVLPFGADTKGRQSVLSFVETGQLTDTGRPNYLIQGR